MQDKILSVFYGEDRLPYKDASRETHYPIVNGNVFNGANNVTKIRYYLDRIGGFTNVTWVVVSKLPNGQLASEVLNSNNALYDEELGEHYIDFEISSYYTTLKGDVYLSLQGYQGGVEVEQDEDTGIYSIYGTPTIQATGSIKIGVNYAPQIVQGTHFTTSDLQQVLGLISEKANISDTIILIDNAGVDISGFNVGQVFFDKQTKSYWVKGNDNSLQSYDIKLERAVTLTGTETIANIILPQIDIGNWGIGKYNDTLLFVKVLMTITPTPHIEYTIYQLSNIGGIKCWYNNNATGSETIAQVLATTPTNVYATQEYVGTQLSNYYTKSETEEKIDDAIAEFLQNEYTKVNTTTYPTLDDFLASTGEEGYIYLYPINVSDESKGYYQYIWENNEWVSLGTTTIDLSNYYTKDEADDKFATITYVDTELDTKQDTLVSGTNIKTLNGTSLLGSGNIEFDDEFDEESTNALQNQVISKEIKELNYELAIIREELFEVLLTELDYKVSYATNYAIPDSLSDSDGTHRLVYSETMLKEVEGNGVSMNQQNPQADFHSADGINVQEPNYSSFSVSNNKCTFSITQNISTGTNLRITNTKIIKGHKYLATCTIKSVVGNNSISVGTAADILAETINENATYYYTHLFTSSDDYTYIVVRYIGSHSASQSVELSNLLLFDLTQMFGAGNEPTTTSDNRIQWLLSLDYIPYNTGSLENTTISGIKINGYNLFDEEIEGGTYSGTTGLPVSATDNYRSKNKTKVVPSTQYTIEWSIPCTTILIYYYDKNDNLISYLLQNVSQTTFSHNFTTPSNCVNVNISFYKSSSGWGTNPPTKEQAQVCLHLQGSRTGYAPYVAPTIISLPQTTLLGALNSHDTLSVVEGNVVEGEQLYNIVHKNKIIEYTITGNEVYEPFITPGGGFGQHYGISMKLPTQYQGKTDTRTGNGAICSRDFKFAYSNASGNAYMFGDMSGINFINDNWTTEQTFKANLIDITINFGLKESEYQTTIVAQDLHFDQISSIIEQGGTIEPIFEDVPPNITTTFVVKKAVGE